MAQKMNQVLAVEKAVKNRTETEVTKAFQLLQKPDLLNGFSKTYKPKDEEGETFSPESKKVQFRAEDLINTIKTATKELINTVALKDKTNCVAKADIVMDDGTVIAKDVPATHLLFLEKKIQDFLNEAKVLPALDPNEDWSVDEGTDLWVTAPYDSFKTKKVTTHHVIVQPTPQHPAQIRDDVEDIIQGTWTTRKYSGALAQSRINQIRKRAEDLQKAVKKARAVANTAEVDPTLQPGEKIVEYVFGA